jgi:site-specific DNA-methyltransferase (adenine-specific)
MKYNEIILGNNVDVLKTFPDECIDLTVTSPPYDLIREYKGKIKEVSFNGYSFPFEELAQQLFRVTKIGGVVVWVVNDGTSNGSRTGNSLRQALYFKNCGFNIHDYMFYEKNGCNFPSTNRYYQVSEFMFVFSKGKPKIVRLIKDRPNIWSGESNWGKKTSRSGSDNLKHEKSHITPEFGARFNIWRYNTGKGFSTKDEYAFEHPAIFPEELVRDHILSWSNIGDIVLDPFIGSGTTAKMAVIHQRKYIGIDINEEFVKLSETRVKDHGIILNDNYSDEVFINSLIEKQKLKVRKKIEKEEENLPKEKNLLENIIK